MIDFAADAAALFGDVLTRPAQHVPLQGAAANIRVLPRGGDVISQFGEIQAISDRAVFVSPVAGFSVDPRQGDAIILDGVTYTLLSDPLRDARRLTWTMEVGVR